MGKSLVTGLAVGALNPKNIVVGIAAAASIASGLEGESTSAFVIVIAAYALFASLGVLAPLAENNIILAGFALVTFCLFLHLFFQEEDKSVWRAKQLAGAVDNRL